MKKRVAYHFQAASEQQTAESSAVSVKTHPPSFLPRRKPNDHSNLLHPILG
ncbi:unnamed protein product [Hymenolepis diminuta]|uniref:Uncharacterized protein n=1 Tax=Hymenolepis diminuta TaxID=6216 RepID=A0A564YD26_HYMDI|nr:unnamed protein product [Hymenolepis diminuta]